MHAVARPSRYFLSQLKRLKCSKEIEARLTRWRQVRLLLAGMGKDGSESQGRSVAQVRSPPPFRSPSSTKARPASPVSTGTSRVNCELSRSSKAKCVNDYDRPVTRKEMYSENVRNRVRFLFPCFSSTQEGRGLETGDRLVGSEQLSSPGYIRDGHVSQGQVSGSSGYVGDVAGLVRRLPSCPIRKECQKFLCFQVGNSRYMYLVLPFGLNSGPWAFTEVVKQLKALDSSSTVDSVSISGRLVEPTSFVSSGGDKHGTASSTMPTSGPSSERGEVGADSLSGHRISGRETRFSAGQGISVGDQKITDRVGPSRRSKRRRSARNEGGVTAGPACRRHSQQSR